MPTFGPVKCNVIGFEPHGTKQEKGDHASDLVEKREIFTHEGESDRCAVAITLEHTNTFIRKLIASGVSRENIVSLCSLMRQSPGGVTPLHFLFGPQAQENLKLAVGMNRKLSPLVREIVDRSEAQGMEIIETDIPRHDLCSGFTQGLTNFIQLLIGDTSPELLREQCMQKWGTAPSTIFGLIYNNADSELAIVQFFEELKRNDNFPLQTFLQVIERNLTDQDLRNFSTPNFERLMKIAGKETSHVRLTNERINHVRSHLNSDGEVWLPKEIQRIRKNIHKSQT